jgi:hypothetical protein
MKTIVTMTMNPAIDKSASVAHVVAERKLHCRIPRFEPGGGGVNVCRAIKKLGGESMLLYPAGGLTGERLQELLDQECLDRSFKNKNGKNFFGNCRFQNGNPITWWPAEAFPRAYPLTFMHGLRASERTGEQK